MEAPDLMTLNWWFSFADPYKPRGQTFLGVVIVKPNADGLAQAKARFAALGRTPTPENLAWAAALETARVIGCNPGGQAEGFPLHPLQVVAPEMMNRLLTRAEGEQVEAMWPDPGQPMTKN